jgi:hypothetical protein
VVREKASAVGDRRRVLHVHAHDVRERSYDEIITDALGAARRAELRGRPS